MTDPEALVIALRLADPILAKRVATLLGDVAGITLVAGNETADLVLAPAEPEARAGMTLTPREREVVARLAEGLSNKAIAPRLGIAPDTAKVHVSRLIDNLDAAGRTDAVAQAARRGIVHL